MEAGGAAADDVKTVAVVEVDPSAQAVGGESGAGGSAVAARTTAVESSVIGSVVVGTVVAATADLDAGESATGGGDGVAEASSIACGDAAAAVKVAADLVEEASSSAAVKTVADLVAAPAAGDVSEVQADMQMEVSSLSLVFAFD
jgi:hypothetical protein